MNCELICVLIFIISFFFFFFFFFFGGGGGDILGLKGSRVTRPFFLLPKC
jgi:hypothetical protein